MQWIIALLLLLAQMSYGLNSVTVDDVTYEQIKLKKEYPSSLFIEHSGGTAFIQKSKLTEDQVASIVSGQPQSSDGNQSQSGQDLADDGYIYERDSNNNITSIRIPDSVTAVECTKFQDAPELTSVYVGKSVEKFGGQNFQHSEKLVKYDVSPDNPHYSSEDGVILSKDKTVLVRVPAGKEGTYTTPKGVKRIAYEAIRHTTKLTEVEVGEGVEEIERSGISGKLDSLTNIVVSQSVTQIQDAAFSGPFNALVSITLPEKFQSEQEFERIGLGAARWASLQRKVSSP